MKKPKKDRIHTSVAAPCLAESTKACFLCASRETVTSTVSLIIEFCTQQKIYNSRRVV